MLRNPFKKDPTILDDLITTLQIEMDRKGPYSEEYPSLMVKLERLHKLKTQESSTPVGKDTIAIVAGNLLGIFLVVAYEQKHVLTSKGLGMIQRIR